MGDSVKEDGEDPVKCEICDLIITKDGPIDSEGTCQDDHPILSAAKIGDKHELERLLQQKKENLPPESKFVYPKHWTYTFNDLLKRDKDGRTALHLAAMFGDHTSALSCVQLILESDQVFVDEFINVKNSQILWKFEKKNSTLLEKVDWENEETPLHLAIKSKAVAVVSYFLKNQANMLATDKDGTNTLEIIYTQIPAAMKELYDECIQLKAIPQGKGTTSQQGYDHTSFTVDWGPVVGCQLRSKDDTQTEVNGSPRNQTCCLLLQDSPIRFWDAKETKCLSYILGAEQGGTDLLSHPLIKWYMRLKWERISWLFWITFALQIIWLSFYTAIFVDLQLNIAGLKEENCGETPEGMLPIPEASKDGSECDTSTEDLHVNWAWHSMTAVAILELAKEVYQISVLNLKVYWSSPENVLQLFFIGLFAFQYIILLSTNSVETDVLASISAIAIITSAVLVIFQLGKTPTFGLQVAAFRKVFHSCAPHLPMFIIWFVGFGLAFWAMFYNAETSWTVGMIAIIAAMGTGELNAKENLEGMVTGSFSISELINVFCILLFVVVIVTLYFNLLVGYAVTDLQVLLPQAETLRLANKLNTIYTIESFLVTPPGKILTAIRSRIRRLCGKEDVSIYVLSPNKSTSSGQYKAEYKFSQLPEDQLDAMRKLAFVNVVKKTEEKGKSSNLTKTLSWGNGHIQVQEEPMSKKLKIEFKNVTFTDLTLSMQ